MLYGSLQLFLVVSYLDFAGSFRFLTDMLPVARRKAQQRIVSSRAPLSRATDPKSTDSLVYRSADSESCHTLF